MTRLYWFGVLGAIAVPFAACGPDAKPGPPCEGPTFNLVVTAENGALPADTRLNVRYGGNHDGEPYVLGQTPAPQAVFCDELSAGGAAAVSAELGGAPATGGAENSAGASVESSGVWALSCHLYTQGPARIDLTASGYESIEGQDLLLPEKERCQVGIEVKLKRAMDAGSD